MVEGQEKLRNRFPIDDERWEGADLDERKHREMIESLRNEYMAARFGENWKTLAGETPDSRAATMQTAGSRLLPGDIGPSSQALHPFSQGWIPDAAIWPGRVPDIGEHLSAAWVQVLPDLSVPWDEEQKRRKY